MQNKYLSIFCKYSAPAILAPFIMLAKLIKQFCSMLQFQAMAVREGMAWIIPVPLLSLLTARNLEQLVCGMEQVSIDVLRKIVR